LLYDEWLRREGRVTTGASIHTAHDVLAAIGMQGFAERARKELVTSGGRVPRGRQRPGTIRPGRSGRLRD